MKERTTLADKEQDFNKSKAKTALMYALASVTGAGVGFLAWTPRPDILVSNTVEQIQSITGLK